jgi:hypothetical protein
VSHERCSLRHRSQNKIRRSNFPPPHHPFPRRDAVYFLSGVYTLAESRPDWHFRRQDAMPMSASGHADDASLLPAQRLPQSFGSSGRTGYGRVFLLSENRIGSLIHRLAASASTLGVQPIHPATAGLYAGTTVVRSTQSVPIRHQDHRPIPR